jgi:hypothetical protein
MYEPNRFTSTAQARVMAQQRVERERVQRRLTSQARVYADDDTAVATPRRTLAGTFLACRASFSHALAPLLRYARIRTGTTPA